MSSEQEKLKIIADTLEEIRRDRNLNIEVKIKELDKLKKQILEIQRKKEYDKKYKKQKLCKTLQKKISEDIQDPESIFNNIEFLRTITKCKLPQKNEIK